MTVARPNILLIIADQWRADCFSHAGHPVVETPTLDWLAESSLRFTRAYCATPSCIAARAGLWTGLSQRSHGRVGYEDGVPWNYRVTLPQLLTDAGYQTHCVGKMHVHPVRNKIGFENVELHDGFLHHVRNGRTEEQDDDYLKWLRQRHGPLADFTDTGLGCNGYSVRPWPYDEMSHPTNWVATRCVDFLRNRRDRQHPFFLTASFVRPHPPFDPPDYFLRLYENKKLPPIPRGAWQKDIPHYLPGPESPRPRTAALVDRARRGYYACLSHVDNQINRLITALVEENIYEQTAILFLSDHGEMLFDHEFVAKSLPYEGSTHIPFLLKLPHPAPTGERDSVVELRDVLPTLCEIAGVSVPASVEGRSVLGAPREYLHGEHVAAEISHHHLTDGREKYIWYSQTGREQLFDLQRDPQEMRDLAKTKPTRVAHGRARLIQELTGREEGFVANGKLVVGRPSPETLSSARRG
ncbi:MAG: arylsulfatase [Verrucomicrobiae bacterium]|nr:arylsulfatase [Verrucomicrobiae bacterium]